MTTRKTVFITGASRGIGLAIAKALSATNNFNLAIASKTTTVQKTLPGTIYTAADEIRALGGDCLALECDIRFEDQIQTAVSKTVDRFGGIDVVINNASAIDLSTMEQGSLKKFDLMNQINSRGTWLVSKICLPFLEISARNNRNPMILMMAPPLDLSPHWFGAHVGYSMSKYGMSLCVLGLAAELDGRIGVNALWPRTGIETSAVSNVIVGDINALKTARKVDIMADAALSILNQNCKTFTGQFCIDETVLIKQGVLNFDSYKVDLRTRDEDLMPDFFVPVDWKEFPKMDMKKISKL